MSQPEVYENTLDDQNVLCYGNNKIPSSKFREFYENHSEEFTRDLTIRISLYYAPDLDLFNRFEDPVYTPEVRELIEQGEIDVFLILISLEHVMSSSMYELLKSIPNQLGLSEESFWKKAAIAFSMKDCSDPERYIQASIDGNFGVRKIVEKVRGRYTYISKTEPNAFWSNLLKQRPQKPPNLSNKNEVFTTARSLPFFQSGRDEVTHTPRESERIYLCRPSTAVGNTLWGKFKARKCIIVSTLVIVFICFCVVIALISSLIPYS